MFCFTDVPEQFEDEDEDIIEQFEDEDVCGAFTYLFTALGILFGKIDFSTLKRACMQRGTLLPSTYKQQIKEAVNLDDLLDTLDNPTYCNWLNIRILKRIVLSVNIDEGKNLIQAYEKCVYSRKVSDVRKYLHSDYFKKSHWRLIYFKIITSSESLTVADIIKYCESLENYVEIPGIPVIVH